MRRFVEVRLRDLQKLLNAEARIARAAIGKHVLQKITMTPEEKTYFASGSWLLRGRSGLLAWCRGPGMHGFATG
jgi:hypothetical protein